MFRMFFQIPREMTPEINNWMDANEIHNVSLFEDEASGFLDTLDENGFPVAKLYNVEIYHDDNSKLLSMRQECHDIFGIESCIIDAIDDIDWEKVYIGNLKPTKIGKFYLYNDNYHVSCDDLINVKINSVMAFGTGEHETTAMSIELLSHIPCSSVSSILDMGCGTGILGICSAKLFPEASLTSVDIDPNALEATKSNFEANGIAGDILINDNNNKFFNENTKQFDLILCNILQNPLIQMKDEFLKILRGYIITSGYIRDQEHSILAAYKDMNPIHTLSKNQWVAHLFSYNTA